MDKVGRRVTLTVAKAAAARARAMSWCGRSNAATERGLLYRQWVEERRAYVAKASGGRLGYVHMLDMRRRRSPSCISTWTPTTTRARASSSTCATTTAGS